MHVFHSSHLNHLPGKELDLKSPAYTASKGKIGTESVRSGSIVFVYPGDLAPVHSRNFKSHPLVGKSSGILKLSYVIHRSWKSGVSRVVPSRIEARCARRSVTLIRTATVRSHKDLASSTVLAYL
ncbi:hypothetical protein L3X38_000257 (mitochondrion) [Prunus dulcis]|uniref:Uncharacterized protein n=1 Tax=Prunus dulcis TaxID=3755 RepID=A0AAD4USX8_PRUDU|nr:hypothetical protein L3X38_000257 [Prunus dulcis]